MTSDNFFLTRKAKKKNNTGNIFLVLIIFLLTSISIYFLFRNFKHEVPSENNTPKSTANTKKIIKDNPLSGNNNQKPNKYQPIQATLKEAEYQGKLLPISSVGTEYKKAVSEANMLPRGCAILTSSGDLKRVVGGTHCSSSSSRETCANCGIRGKMTKIITWQCTVCGKEKNGDGKWRCEKCNNQKFQHNCKKNQGIEAIIHACPGSIEKKDKSEFEPNIQGIIRSVQNSIILAEKNNYKSVAFCLVGSSFLDRIFQTKEPKKEKQLKLAEIVIKSAVEQRKSLEKIVFVDFGNSAFTKVFFENDWGKDFYEKLNGVGVHSGNKWEENKNKVEKRGITDYSLHQCEVIVNSLNMEGEFINSGSFSGFIAGKTGSAKEKIQNDLRNYINEFNKRTLGTK